MSDKVETLARNMRLTDNTREYIEKKAAKLPRHLPGIDDIRVELSHEKTARNANDRHIAQITVRGKKLLLRSEERSDDLHSAFDAALEKIKHQMERYKGKHYHGRGDGRSAADAVVEEDLPLDDTGELPPLVARRKKFVILPMNEEEAIEQMRLLGHDNFFVFFNPSQNSIQILYRRRNGSYGLIEPIIG